MRYKTAAELDMAVRDAAKASPQDASRAIAGFYFHRLLCRVFSEPEPRFVLKGATVENAVDDACHYLLSLG